jgi:hypothetical protein
MGHSPYSLGSVVFKNEINMMAALNAACLVLALFKHAVVSKHAYDHRQHKQAGLF